MPGESIAIDADRAGLGRALFAHANEGFVVLDFFRRAPGDEVLLYVVETDRILSVLVTPLVEPGSSPPRRRALRTSR